jgi:hypothetical protein
VKTEFTELGPLIENVSDEASGAIFGRSPKILCEPVEMARDLFTAIQCCWLCSKEPQRGAFIPE